MAKSVNRILLFTFALSFARKGEQTDFTQEHERRWNTPPELTPESVVKTSNDEKFQMRLLSLSPVTATFSLNTGNNNAHSVSLGATLDGISLSESNNYNHPTGHGIDGSSVSVSKSTTLSAGLSGISTAGAEAYSEGNNAKTESHSLSFGQASATSFGVVENGQAITGASSSVGTSQSSAIGDNRGQSFSQASAISTQYQNRPTWNNVGPSNEYNDRRFGRPTLTISKPYDRTRPTLNIGIADIHRREQKPTIHIYKWRPNHRVLPRPNLSIEHRQHNSWDSQTHGSIPQFGISSNSGSYAFSAGDSVSQAHSFSSVSGHRNGNSMEQVNAQTVGNGHAHGIASSEGGSFIRFPENGNSQIIPLQYVRNKSSKQYDGDVFSDLAQTVGELLDIV